MSSNINLSGKTAFITGATKGIGLGIAERMAAEGMRVAITGRSNADAKKVAEHLIKFGAPDAIGLACDVRDDKAMGSAVSEIIHQWGRLDVVIANAGIGHFDSIDTMSLEKWKEVIDINLTGVFN